MHNSCKLLHNHLISTINLLSTGNTILKPINNIFIFVIEKLISGINFIQLETDEQYNNYYTDTQSETLYS